MRLTVHLLRCKVLYWKLCRNDKLPLVTKPLSWKRPFLVLATQNPVEQEGTYPLPEAQLDRFMMKLSIDYPTEDEELEIMRRQARTAEPLFLRQIATVDQILSARKIIDSIYVDEKVEKYIVSLVIATRYPEKYGLAEIKSLLNMGVPQGGLSLLTSLVELMLL